jgi:hypothetical protein
MVAQALAAATAVDRAVEPTGPARGRPSPADDRSGTAVPAGQAVLLSEPTASEDRRAAGPGDRRERGGGAVADVASRPAIAEQPSGDLGEEDLYGLARLLDQAPPTVDPGPAHRAAAARAEAAEAARVRTRWVRVIVAAGLALPLGVALAVAGPPVGLALAGLLLAACGAALAVVAAFGLRSASAHLATARAALSGAELQETTGRTEAQAAQIRRDQAIARATAAGLPADPAALRERAQRMGERRGSELVEERWRRGGQDRLLAAARAAGRPATSPAEAESGLRSWQREQADAAARRESHALDRRQLETVLAGETLDELRQRVSTLDGRAAALAARVDPASVSTVDGLADDPSALRARAEAAGRAAHGAEVALGQWLTGVHPVGEAEEEFQRAQAELTRLRELDTTLDITEQFLARAEETAHRSIAPRLVETVRAWLPSITSGRYTDVLVDPERLEVRVRADGGRWREAGRLSYGTAEQIYLVLRIALAEQLARPGVRCPLLLDDVTVHADARRTGQLLDLLLRAAADRQIILFTQQDQVVEWARTHLTEPRHAVIELAEVPAG